MRQKHPQVGDVVQVALPNGHYAYGRVLRDGAVAFYRVRSAGPGQPPIGSREFDFIVGVYEDVLTSGTWPVIGKDPSSDPDEDWPPPESVTDPITKRVKIYERGQMRVGSEGEAGRLEPAAVWDSQHVLDRLMQPSKAN